MLSEYDREWYVILALASALTWASWILMAAFYGL